MFLCFVYHGSKLNSCSLPKKNVSMFVSLEICLKYPTQIDLSHINITSDEQLFYLLNDYQRIHNPNTNCTINKKTKKGKKIQIGILNHSMRN